MLWHIYYLRRFYDTCHMKLYYIGNTDTHNKYNTHPEIVINKVHTDLSYTGSLQHK